MDGDVLDAAKAQAEIRAIGYQTFMNDILRRALIPRLGPLDVSKLDQALMELESVKQRLEVLEDKSA